MEASSTCSAATRRQMKSLLKSLHQQLNPPLQLSKVSATSLSLQKTPGRVPFAAWSTKMTRRNAQHARRRNPDRQSASLARALLHQRQQQQACLVSETNSNPQKTPGLVPCVASSTRKIKTSVQPVNHRGRDNRRNQARSSCCHL